MSLDAQADERREMLTIGSDDNLMNMFVPHLFSGFACMDFLSTLPYDLSLLKGNVGCRPGAFFLYLGCRYLSILSIMFTLVYYDVSSVASVDVLDYIDRVTAAISLGFAFSIIVVRVCAMYKNLYVSLGLELAMLVFWALLFKSMENITSNSHWDVHMGTHIVISSFTLLLSTCALALGLLYVLYFAKHEHHYKIRRCFKMLWDAEILELGLIWATSLPDSVLLYVGVPDSFDAALRCFTLNYGSFVVVTAVSSRIYRKMSYRSDFCPVTQYSMVYTWIKIGAVYIRRKLGCGERTENSSSILRIFCPHRPRAPIAVRSLHTSVRTSVSLPVTTSSSRPPGRHKRAPRPCVTVNSRSTYAHSALYDSRAS